MLGDRIKRARKALGLSLRDLAEKLGVSHAAIKKYEDGDVIPSSDVLISLAKNLKVKVEYFFRPESYSLGNIRYRKDADISAKQRDAISAKIIDFMEQRIELEGLFPKPPVSRFKPLKTTSDIANNAERFAAHVRKAWSLGDDPIIDLIDLFEEHGIKVFGIDASCESFEGLYASVDNIPVVVFNKNKPGDRQRFTLAHELGHILLNDAVIKIKEEKWCNQFAGSFLLPGKPLIKAFGEKRTNIEPKELELLKQEFGVSMLCILHRLEENKIISPRLYKEIREIFNQRGWVKQEPGIAYPPEVSRIFEQMVFHALAEDYIGESKAAELMNISLESLRSLRAMELREDAINC